MEDWKTCYAWRHLGAWPDASHLDRRRAKAVVELFLLDLIGLPLGTGDVVAFDCSEYDALLTLVFITTCFGWSVGDDLYLVPDHANQIIKTDHHDVVHAQFRSEKDVEHWVAEMSRCEFNLPDEPSDWTFKRPPWM